MLLFLTTSTGSVWSGPSGVSGWTQLDTFTNGSTVSTLWRKTAASGDPGATVRFTSSAYHKAVVDLVVYSGVGSGAAVIARAGDSARATHTAPAVTAPANSVVVSVWADKSSTTTSWSAPSGVTVRDTALGTGSGRFTALVADSGGAVAGGTYGPLTATTNASDTHADAWTVALPAA
jgi:hypothetical protein